MKIDLATNITPVDTRLSTFELRGNPLTGAAYVETSVASGNISKVNKSGTITVGGSSQTLMAAKTDRRGWQLQNNSTGDIWFNELGNAAALSQPSFKLGPGDSYESPIGGVSTAAITVIGATTGQTFTAREW